jgi:hypothetical protein
MKAIKINSKVNLTSGIEIAEGSIVVIAEGYADVKSTKEGLIPSQVATLLYASEEALMSGKDPIIGIADFNPVFSNLELSVSDFETISAESLLVNAVFNQLALVYGSDNIEIVVI